jgi:hypothetical protein
MTAKLIRFKGAIYRLAARHGREQHGPLSHEDRALVTRATNQLLQELIGKRPDQLVGWERGVISKRPGQHPYWFRSISALLDTSVPVEVWLFNEDAAEDIFGPSLDFSVAPAASTWVNAQDQKIEVELPWLHQDQPIQVDKEAKYELLHELVHVLDNLQDAAQAGTIKEPWPALLNDPTEMRAYFNMGAAKLEDRIQAQLKTLKFGTKEMWDKLDAATKKEIQEWWRETWQEFDGNARLFSEEMDITSKDSFLKRAPRLYFSAYWKAYLGSDNNRRLSEMLGDLWDHLNQRYRFTGLPLVQEEVDALLR